MRRMYLSCIKVAEIIKRTYGDQRWVDHNGLTTSKEISGSDIFEILEVNGQLPISISAISSDVTQHKNTTEKILSKWKEILENHSEIIYNAFKTSLKYETLEERGNSVIASLKNVPIPNLIKGTSFNGLMGSVIISGNNITIGGKKSNQVINSIPKNEIVAIANLTCDILKSQNDFFSTYLVPIIHDEDVADFEIEDSDSSILEELHKKNPHVSTLVDGDSQNDRYLNSYWEVASSLVNIAHALERWMHRSVK